jgi:hypothetical protein
MANVIVIKKGAGIPAPDQLKEAELALDVTDGALYSKLQDGNIHHLNDGADDVDLSDYVTEAPIDTKQYARQDGSWSEIVIPDGGTGSSVHIGDTPPDSPQEGQQWMEVPASGDATMWIFDGDKWLEQPSNGGSSADLTGYATEAYVGEAIAAIPETDLSDYYTSTEAEAVFQPKGDYQPAGDYANSSHNHDGTYQPVGSYIGDAPQDGELYVRKDGKWEVYTPSNGGSGGSLMEPILQPVTLGDFTLGDDKLGSNPTSYASPQEMPLGGITYTMNIPDGLHFVLLNVCSEGESFRLSDLVIDGVKPYPTLTRGYENSCCWVGDGFAGKPNFIAKNSIQITGNSTGWQGQLYIYGFCVSDGSTRTAALQGLTKKGREAVSKAKENVSATTQEIAE